MESYNITAIEYLRTPEGLKDEQVQYELTKNTNSRSTVFHSLDSVKEGIIGSIDSLTDKVEIGSFIAIKESTIPREGIDQAIMRRELTNDELRNLTKAVLIELRK